MDRDEREHVRALCGVATGIGPNIVTKALDALDEADRAAELAEGTVAALRDKLGEVERERDALRAIIEGRTTPPTDAEIREHAERGGAWLVTLPPRAQVRMMPETRYTSDPVEVSRLWWSEGAWWVPVRYGRPCSWPTAEVPRG